ncbi:hypothetical protein [Aquirufa nivalisilvae]|uniref:hypothetical protein n=1 Tax=Aquirufa nivalisilvae TaxID=2516557 RepID=UPI001032814C|nr:hypothetical protein [Aquirufa nivalisilvae]TBH73870.1 hypothetical protein EWU22_09430 [Aquirufa nivalisilvae]
MAHVIEIKARIINQFFISFLLGFSIVFGLQHYQKIEFMPEYTPTNISGLKPSFEESIPYNTKISYLSMGTYFGNMYKEKGNGLMIIDLYDNKVFNYEMKSRYYFEATVLDYKYGILISIICFIFILFIDNIKIKLT